MKLTVHTVQHFASKLNTTTVLLSPTSSHKETKNKRKNSPASWFRTPRTPRPGHANHKAVVSSPPSANAACPHHHHYQSASPMHNAAKQCPIFRSRHTRSWPPFACITRFRSITKPHSPRFGICRRHTRAYVPPLANILQLRVPAPVHHAPAGRPPAGLGSAMHSYHPKSILQHVFNSLICNSHLCASYPE